MLYQVIQYNSEKGELLRDKAEWQSRDVTLSDGLEEAAKMNGFQYEIEFRGSLLFNLFEGTFASVYPRYPTRYEGGYEI
ncbi:hypothetical protein B5X24_HaOG207240 [Helicoverpa armigera]|nr:hypothetical protein B5X24_HaOG207240 [Helicoverpa armigera]